MTNGGGSSVVRVRGSDGRILETWTGAVSPFGILTAMGRVFATGFTNPGNLYRIDPSQPAGAVTTVASNLGNASAGIAFDGARIWVANPGGASVSIVTPGASLPWTVTTVTTGFSGPFWIVWDGANMWAVESNFLRVERLDANGAILQTVTIPGPLGPVFDGTNLWIPGATNNTLTVLRASTGAILATLTGNGLDFPETAAFD